MSRTPTLMCAVLFAAVLTACDRGASEFGERFTAACMETTNIPEPVCTCMAERAESDLSADARAFLLAGLEGDQEEIEATRARLGVTEAMQAGLFMTGVGDCAASLEGEMPSNP